MHHTLKYFFKILVFTWPIEERDGVLEHLGTRDTHDELGAEPEGGYGAEPFVQVRQELGETPGSRNLRHVTHSV